MITLAANVRVLDNFGKLTYADSTVVHPLGLALLIVCCAMLLCLPRRLALIPVLVMALLIPSAQRIAILTLDFTFLRIMIITGLVRVMRNREQPSFNFRGMDGVVLAWASTLFAASVLRTGGGSLIYECGYAMDVLGAYFLFRCLVRGWADVITLAQTTVILSVLLAAAFLYEHRTHYNVFSIFGGVKEYTAVRFGRLRCMGPYNHPILAGCVWAALAPVCILLWRTGPRGKFEAGIGAACALIIVYCCASSTPVFGVLVAAGGLLLLPAGNYLRILRWGAFAMLVGLHIIMTQPVWHLIGRVSAVGGSTGWHRFLLIDHFVRRFGEWALVGTDRTASWFWGGQDLTNHYVAQGVRGGLATLLLFVAVLAGSFAAIGRARVAARSDPTRSFMAWCVGVSLLVHCACFLGVSYFGQITFILFMTLGIASGIAGFEQIRTEGRVARARVLPGAPSGSLAAGRALTA